MTMKQVGLALAFAIVSQSFMQVDRARAISHYESHSAINLTTEPVQPRVRPCVHENLRIKEGETEAAMGGVRATPYIFTNTSSSACTLDGYPAVELLNQRGVIVRRSTKQKSDELATATLEPGKTAWFNLNYNSGGAGHIGKPCPAYQKIRITAPAIARPFVLRTDIQTCAQTNFEVSSISPGTPQ